MSGGTTPLTGFHSVIDSPDSVSRVIPPTTTIATISPATANSQRASIAGRAVVTKLRVAWSMADT